MKSANSGKWLALAAAGALAGLYAARKLTRRENAEELWKANAYIWEHKDGIHMDTYEMLFARRQREQYVHEHKRDPDVFLRHYGQGTLRDYRERIEDRLHQTHPSWSAEQLRAGAERIIHTYGTTGLGPLTRTGDEYMPKERKGKRAGTGKMRESLQYSMAVVLVNRQLVLTNKQMSTLGVLDEMASITFVKIEHTSSVGLQERTFQQPYDALITLQAESGACGYFTVGPDGALRPLVDEDDGGDEEKEATAREEENAKDEYLEEL